MTLPPDGSILTGAERERFVTGLFDRIAQPYDRLNRLISLGRDLAWRRAALDCAAIAPGMSAVDLGCGTGDFFILLARRTGAGGRVVGIDLSPGMLERARAKAAAALPGIAVDLRLGGADTTGLPDASADVVTMGWVLRNVGDRAAVYREVLRILRPGGRFVALDMSQPDFAPLRWASRAYVGAIMPLAVRCAGGDALAYRYLARSTARFPRKAALAQEWRDAGFRNVRFRGFMAGNIALHAGER
jgi:demethylmenaquinone methyltransferase / 2-methoxy-6-polyprenyl-1,4-benzoquinol methylase